MRAIPATIFFVLVFMGLVTGVEWLVNQIELSRCPASAYLTGSLHGRIPELAIDGGLIALMIGIALLRPPPRTSAASKDSGRYPAQLIISAMSFVFATLLLFVGTATVLQQYCLSEGGIDSQSSISGRMQHHPWSAVVMITSSCQVGTRYGKFPKYRLVLDDDEQIVLLPQQIEFDRVYKRLSESLSGASFVFDASAVDARCGYPKLDLLTRPP
jgi:hypothetical protein